MLAKGRGRYEAPSVLGWLTLWNHTRISAFCSDLSWRQSGLCLARCLQLISASRTLSTRSKAMLLWASKASLHLCFATVHVWTFGFQGLACCNFPCDDVLCSLWKQGVTQALMSRCPIEKLEKTLLLNTDLTMLVNSACRCYQSHKCVIQIKAVEVTLLEK